MSSYPTMARSAGTRQPVPMASWSRPSAMRSLAQNAAVGRRDAGSPASRSPAPRPSATVRAAVVSSIRSSGGSPASAHAACAPA